MENDENIEHRLAAISKQREVQSKNYLFDQTRIFVDYWFKLPKRGIMPDKASFSPRGIIELLPGVIILEATPDAPGFRIRLFGTGNVGRWGFEATNTEFLNFAAPQHYAAITEKFSFVHKIPCGVIVSGDELYTSGCMVRNEMVLMPVHNNVNGPKILFGLISTEHDNNIKYGTDTLASVFYTINTTHFINIGAGTPI